MAAGPKLVTFGISLAITFAVATALGGLTIEPDQRSLSDYL